MWGPYHFQNEIDFGRPAGRSPAQHAERSLEAGPVFGCGGRGFEAAQRVKGIDAFRHVVEKARRRTGSDARLQLRDPGSRHPVANVLSPAQDRQHILDVRGFKKFQAAEFHEGNVATRELDFEACAVVRGAKQNGLRLESDTGFAVQQ
jgi:hypothetical protein